MLQHHLLYVTFKKKRDFKETLSLFLSEVLYPLCNKDMSYVCVSECYYMILKPFGEKVKELFLPIPHILSIFLFYLLYINDDVL
jgi:hypothetical protein